jgi:hypothetical protein
MLNQPCDNTNFWSKVHKTTTCWLWTAHTDRDGYGTITANKRQYRAHRYSLIIHGHTVPKTSKVLHTCDNPSCVNPAHLKIGTQQQNIVDRQNKKRQAVGERVGASKLTEQDVLDIRNAYPAIKLRELARKYNVSEGTIRCVVRRLTWQHI